MIIKYTIILLLFWGLANLVWWGYQEYIYREDTLAIRSLDNQINIDITRIEEKQQTLDSRKKIIDSKGPELEQLLANKNTVEYNDLAKKQNQLIAEYNDLAKEYNVLLDKYNENIRKINELLKKSGKRTYLFPIPAKEPELYRELE